MRLSTGRIMAPNTDGIIKFDGFEVLILRVKNGFTGRVTREDGTPFMADNAVVDVYSTGIHPEAAEVVQQIKEEISAGSLRVAKVP
jgi:hypothetical protein